MVSVQNKKLRLLLLCKENVISTKFMHLLDLSPFFTDTLHYKFCNFKRR